jgi:signal transduction histidine kinase/DNA-binding response OmpR family regulator
MTIIITPPWWQTWWFRALVTLFLIGIFIAFYFWRVYSLKARQRELEQNVNERTAELKEANAELFEQKEEISQQKMAISEQNKVLRKQKEKLQDAADEVNAAAQSKIRFFMNVSHEFRTPLTLILGPIETIMQKTKEPFVQNQLLVVHRNAKRLLRLVNQLLDLRRLETGTMKLHASEDDIVLFLRNIFESFQYLARRHRIKYEFKTWLDQWHTWFDHDIIEKVFYNLLSNSFKFTPDGHSICLSVDKMPLKEGDPLREHLKGKSISPRDQRVLIIRVKDTGTGIDPDSINKIFDRFYTYQDNSIRKKSGTGIGLALTKELVETHHGDIEARENVDQGAEFVVRLLLGKDILEPSQVGQQKERTEIDKYPHITDNIEDLENPVEIEIASPDHARKVIVVDDNPDIRLYIRQNLGQEFSVQEASNGEEGLAKALEEIPDLIISDVMMPRMDGIEFTREVKLNEITSHIPVILLTAKTSEESQLEGLETGADDYIIKPFSIEVLKVKVHNLIETREKLREHFTKDPLARPEKFTTNKVDRSFVDKMETIIGEYIADLDFGPEELAREMAMSRTLLYMKMKALTGVTVNDYIKTIRLNKAAKILLEEDTPVNEVAEMVGFKNPKHFSTAFSKQFGQPPSQYGKNNSDHDG